MTKLAPLLVLLLVALAPTSSIAESEQPDGLAVDIRAVAAVVPARTDARALEVYARLIPKGLSMPAKPEVGVWLAELSSGRSEAGRPMDDVSHWIEGAIDIRVRRGEEDGWYPVHYPVTAEFWFNAGRAVGLPKRHADAQIVADGKGWKAEATPRGTTTGPSMSLDWQPGPADPALVDQAYHLPTQPMFPLNAPFKGPDLYRVIYTLNPPYPFQQAIPGGAPPWSATANADAGLVHLKLLGNIDDLNEDLPKLFRGASLADIVDLDQTVPGSYAFYAISLNSQSESVGQGSYPGDTSSPPSRGGTRGEKSAGGSRCRRSRSVTVKLPRRPAGRIHEVRARSGRRYVPARLVRRQRARVDARGLRRGRRTIVVTGYGTHGRRVVVHKTYRFC